jgi:hypothetical protein
MVLALVEAMTGLQLRAHRKSLVPVERLRIPRASGVFGAGESFRLALAGSVWQPQERLMSTTHDDGSDWKRLFKVASAFLATSLVLLAIAF